METQSDETDFLAEVRAHAGVVSAFFIDGDFALASKSNYRQDKKDRSRWRALVSFEEILSTTARSVRPDDWPVSDKTVPLAKRPVIAIALVASSVVDAANLPKSVTDALQGVCYPDDAAARFVAVCTRRRREPRFCLALAAVMPIDSDEVSEKHLASVGASLVLAASERFAT